jgi:uncharacterized small protein (DUF1192 family)
MKKKMSVKDIDKRIEILEKQLAQGQEVNVALQNEINRLKLQAFEEDIREQNNTTQLLKG